MKKLLSAFLIIFFLISAVSANYFIKNNSSSTGAPPYKVSNNALNFDINDYSTFVNWERPDGPAKVGLQVGHWKTEEAPDEMERLRGNGGASGGGKVEWEVNMRIAQETASILRDKGIIVEILPTTIPPDYFADVFISIHADGSEDYNKSGFKAAASWQDISGKAPKLLSEIEKSYQNSTQLSKDQNVTRNMRGYYAFRWWRFEHTIHPMTTAIILETGFLTSPSDREIIVNQPELPAQGIANGVIEYLTSEDLI